MKEIWDDIIMSIVMLLAGAAALAFLFYVASHA
jgi:hypothetical protein